MVQIGGYTVPGTGGGGGGPSFPSNPGQVFTSIEDFVNGAKKDPKGAFQQIIPFLGASGVGGLPGLLAGLSAKGMLGAGGGHSKVDTAGAQPDDPTLGNFWGQNKNGTNPLWLDKTGYNHLKGMLGADNPWFRMQQQNLDNQYGQALNQNAHNTRVAETAGLNQLAASGGFDAGARERMARGVQTQGMMGAQNLAAGNAQNRLGLGIANQEMQADLAGKVQGMDLGMKQYNMGRLGAQNAQNLDVYKTKMGAWGAAKTGDAIQNAGKK